MSNKLSFSQVSMYSTCGEKYKKHYVEGWREKYFHSALAYGSAIDESLNTLLLTKDLAKANEQFDKSWNHQFINKVYTELKQSHLLVYAEKDLNWELLLPEDYKELEAYLLANNVEGTPQEVYELLKEKKSDKGFDNFLPSQRSYYNFVNWLCLRRKGYVMIKAYNEKIMPKIKKVLAVQHKFELQNDVGDTVVAIADIIVEWEDGRNLLLDNKTSAREYEQDQAARSQQLIVYYHQLKEEFKLSDVGFIVMNKNIIVKKFKLCKSCDYDGTGGRHKTCPQENEAGKRCDGEWLTHNSYDCYIQTVVNHVTDTAEDLVLSSFDEANNGIKQGVFYKNLSACKNGPIICPFFRQCWNNDESNVINTKKKDK